MFFFFENREQDAPNGYWPAWTRKVKSGIDLVISCVSSVWWKLCVIHVMFTEASH